MSELFVFLDGREAGTVKQERGRLSFAYSDNWRSVEGAYPLSLSMPLAATEHPHSAIEPFLWGLLPDNEHVLRRWGQRFQVSARSAFALISNVGEDCAGAVQFVRPERLEVLQNQTEPNVEWLTEAEIAARLRVLRNDAAAGRAPQDAGQFSLAGAQPKTALLFDGQRWGIPSRRMPTTHILKPPTGDFDGFAENEHLCLSLARALGLPAARSEVRAFEDVSAIVVTRYDRLRGADPSDPTRIHRVHQEDFCQALRVHPSLKYQNDGGPGPKQIVALLKANASAGAPRQKVRSGSKEGSPDPAYDEDIQTFVIALIFNWLIGATDAHAKNYSVMIGGGGLVRLAPLYDIASVLPYPDIDPLKAKLAMKIGGEYRLRDIGHKQWRDLAADIGINPDEMVSRARAMAERLPENLEAEIEIANKAGLSHPVLRALGEKLNERAAKLAKL